MRLGHGQRRSVMILWAWTALLSALVLYPTFSNNKGNAVIPFGVLTLGVLLYTVFAPSGRRSGATSDNPANGAEPDPGAGPAAVGPAGPPSVGGPGPSPTNGGARGAGSARRPDKVGR
jgi:hypothetical protein